MQEDIKLVRRSHLTAMPSFDPFKDSILIPRVEETSLHCWDGT